MEKLSERDILDTAAYRAVIIRSEYHELRRLGEHYGEHIVKALAKIYSLS